MADKATKTGTMERAVGRRKTAAARVRLMPGKGIITINGRPLEDYFPLSVWQEKVVAPLAVANREKELDVTVRVAGGGVSGRPPRHRPGSHQMERRLAAGIAGGRFTYARPAGQRT